MDSYEYFDHPYWDTRKSRRPGKKYVNPYMPDLSEAAKHGSEFGGQSMTQPPQHFQEMSTPTEGVTTSHSNSTSSDNTRVEGTSSNLATREMIRQRIREQLRVASEAPGLDIAQSPHLHYGRPQQEGGHASDFVHQYPANLHQQQPLQHDPGTFYHSPYTSNAFQQQQQSVEHDLGNFMAPFGQQMSPPQQHPVATAGGYQPNFYHSSPAPEQPAVHRGSPVPHQPRFTKNFGTHTPAFDLSNLNPSPYQEHPFINYLPGPRHHSPRCSPQQHFAHASPAPAAPPATTPGPLSPQIRRKQTFAHLHAMELSKKTLLAKHRDLNDERRAIENRIADIKTRNMENRSLDDDSQMLVRWEETLGRVEKSIEEVSRDWDSAGLEVEEACAEIAVGDWT